MQRPPPGSQADYLPVLDGLRAVSIGLVVASHLGIGGVGFERVVPGAFGVTLFFFISGYLITRQLLASLSAQGRIGFAGFYARRVLRLMPAGVAYIVVAGCLYCLAGGRISVGGWAAALLYGANYFDLWHGYRSTLAGVRHPFNILWSLAIEEHFYLLWPAALALLWRRRALEIVLLLCAAVLVWRFALLHVCFVPGAPAICGPENPNPLWRYNRLYLATDTRLDSIAWGVALALVGARGFLSARWVTATGLVVLAASFAGIGPLARDVLRPTMQGVALLAIVPSLLSPGGGWVSGLLAARPAVFVGRLSYSLYLWHWGALAVADWCAPRFGAIWLSLAVTLSAALALASYYGIERPMLRLRHHFGSRAPLELTMKGQDIAEIAGHTAN
jgi:peptidoglycan/LPS O-acetylase OafA/YrhL